MIMGARISLWLSCFYLECSQKQTHPHSSFCQDLTLWIIIKMVVLRRITYFACNRPCECINFCYTSSTSAVVFFLSRQKRNVGDKWVVSEIVRKNEGFGRHRMFSSLDWIVGKLATHAGHWTRSGPFSRIVLQNSQKERRSTNFLILLSGRQETLEWLD